jgi:hypothetical protein
MVWDVGFLSIPRKVSAAEKEMEGTECAVSGGSFITDFLVVVDLTKGDTRRICTFS